MKLTLNFYSSVHQAYIHPMEQVTMDWRDLYDEFFKQHIVTPNKADVPLYNFAEFKSKDYIPGIRSRLTNEEYVYPDGIVSCARRKENLVGIHALVLDVDAKLTIDEMEGLIDGFQYILYTTHSHSPAKDKFRVIVPYSDPIPAHEFISRRKSFVESWPVDRASFTASQAFYLPSHAQGGQGFSKIVNGITLDWRLFEPYVEPVKEEPTRTYEGEFKGHSISPEEVMRGLMSCTNFHYVPGVSNGSLALTTICKGFGLSRMQFDMVCKSLHTSESLQRSDVRDALWKDAFDRCSVDRLRNFIDENGGTYQPKKSPASEAERLRLQMKARLAK